MTTPNRTVVVAGGTGAVGTGIVRSWLRAGARVVVPSRSAANRATLVAAMSDVASGELITLEGGLDTPDAATALRDAIWSRVKEVDVAVASIGGWSQGPPLTGVTFDVWERVVRDNLTTHFLAMKAFTPILRTNAGIYVHINGFGAEQAVPGAAPVVAMAAAQKSLTLTLAEELKPVNLRVHEVILGPVNTPWRITNGHSRPEWLTPEEIGERIVALVADASAEVLQRWLRR
jgi:NAD(P)-dependent dehydrogenase (short-subunit alcohol dehydrogenase family)